MAQDIKATISRNGDDLYPNVNCLGFSDQVFAAAAEMQEATV